MGIETILGGNGKSKMNSILVEKAINGYRETDHFGFTDEDVKAMKEFEINQIKQKMGILDHKKSYKKRGKKK